MASSSCSARCWPGSSPHGCPARRRWVSSPRWSIAPLVVGGIAALADRAILKRLDYDPEATIVATIGLLYIFQQAALSLYGPDARPVQAPFEWRLQFPWFGYSGYKLAVVAAAIVILLGVRLLLVRTRIGLVMRATQIRPRDRHRLRHRRRPGLCAGLRARRGARGRRGGADRADPAGALPDGRRPAAPVLHRGDHRRAGVPARHGARRRADRPLGRHRLGVLLADPLQDPRDAAGRAWCWCFARRGCSGSARRDRASRRDPRPASGPDRAAGRPAFRAARLSRQQSRADHGAVGLRDGLQHRLRLHRAPQPRPCAVLRLRPLRDRNAGATGGLAGRSGASWPASPAAVWCLLRLGVSRCAPPASPS